MNLTKQHEIIKLPTKNKGVFVIRKDKPRVLMNEKHSPWDWYGNPDGKYYSEQHIYYHLYIISDDEIKKGDWCYDEIAQIVEKALFDQKDLKDNFKKIIATTDTSLENSSTGYTETRSRTFYEKLPQIPQNFIEQYYKEYNNDNIIHDVNVEYEIDKLETEFKNRNIKSNWSKYLPENSIFKLKISKDNTIFIKPIKENWTKEELLKEIETKFNCKNEKQFLKSFIKEL